MSYQFNGSTQYLLANNSIISGYPFTIAAWAKPTNLSGFKAAASQGNSTSNDYVFLAFLNSNGYCGLSLSSGDAASTTSSSTTTGTDTHLAGVYTSSSVQSFINGSAGSIANHSLSFPSFNRISIGVVMRGGGQTGYGALAASEIGFWNVALTASEIASLAAGFTPDQIRPQSLQFYTPLVNNLIDVRGGLAITNNNGASVANHPRVYT
jgi:hypothetical protein